MSQPSLSQLHAFRMVAETGGFSYAADELHMSQPAVSQQVRLLEQALGVALFDRRPRGTVLTAAGAALLPHAVAALTSVDALVAEADAQRTGLTRLRVAAIPTIAPYLLPRVIASLRTQHPALQLQISEMRTDAIVTALEEHRLDLALIATDEPHVATLAFADDLFMLAVPEHDPLVGSHAVPLDAIADRDVLLLEEGHCLRGQALSVCAGVSGARTHDVSASGLSTVCQMVAAGQGVTLLPSIAVPVECRPGSGIHALSLEGAPLGRTLRFAWRATSSLAPQLAELAALLRDELRD